MQVSLSPSYLIRSQFTSAAGHVVPISSSWIVMGFPDLTDSSLLLWSVSVASDEYSWYPTGPGCKRTTKLGVGDSDPFR